MFARTFDRCVEWNRLRRGVLGHLRLDPLVVSLTRRTFEGGMARLASFNWVARHVRELALVAAEHPRLLPFLQLVSRVDGVPGASVLVVAAAGGEVLVPLAEAICRVIDPAARRIVIDPPAGLLDVNAAPATPRAERRRGRARKPPPR